VHRLFTPLLRRLYIFTGAFLVIYYSVLLIQHSPWNKERLYRKLIVGDRDQKLRAVADLVYVNGQTQLMRALKSRSPVVREIAANSLLNLWSLEAGNKAHRVIEDANEAIERGAYSEALVILSELIEKHPKFAEAWNRRATLYWQLHKYKDAVADCQKVIALNPNHFAAWQGMGLCQLHLGELESACESLRAASKINPHDQGLRQLLQHCEDLLDRVSPGPKGSYDLVEIENAPGAIRLSNLNATFGSLPLFGMHARGRGRRLLTTCFLMFVDSTAVHPGGETGAHTASVPVLHHASRVTHHLPRITHHVLA
jgi:tetratricopeptide (TPR) repeat protein